MKKKIIVQHEFLFYKGKIWLSADPILKTLKYLGQDEAVKNIKEIIKANTK